MSEPKVKMEEEKFHRFLAHAYQVMDEFSGNDEDMKKVEGTLALRLGIELTPREEEMLPCPWCGGSPRPIERNPEGNYTIECTNCYVTLPGRPGVFYQSRAFAIAAWNRRHQPPPPTIPTREVHLFDGKDLKTITIPTREELAEAIWHGHSSPTYPWSEENSAHRRQCLRWADAAFRAFGLEPPAEKKAPRIPEPWEPPTREGCCKHGALLAGRCEECEREEEDHGGS